MLCFLPKTRRSGGGADLFHLATQRDGLSHRRDEIVRDRIIFDLDLCPAGDASGLACIRQASQKLRVKLGEPLKPQFSIRPLLGDLSDLGVGFVAQQQSLALAAKVVEFGLSGVPLRGMPRERGLGFA